MAEDKAEIILSCYRAFNEQDRETTEKLIAQPFRFTSPYDDGIDRDAYFERCWPNSKLIKEHIIEHIFLEGDQAFVTYRAITHGGSEFRNTEFLTFKGNRIASVDVYFGASYKDGRFQPQAKGGSE
jgi:enolase